MSAEDRAQRADQERQIAAWEVQEIGVPGHGIFTRDEIKLILDKAKEALDRQSTEEQAYFERYPR